MSLSNGSPTFASSFKRRQEQSVTLRIRAGQRSRPFRTTMHNLCARLFFPEKLHQELRIQRGKVKFENRLVNQLAAGLGRVFFKTGGYPFDCLAYLFAFWHYNGHCCMLLDIENEALLLAGTAENTAAV
jgi:hypothetical protein